MNESLSINKNIQSGFRNLPQCSPYGERDFLYRHSPTEHKVILVGSILQVFQGFMIGLECESLASYNFPSFSCNSTAATPTPEASVLRTKGFIKSGSFNTGSFGEGWGVVSVVAD